MTNNKMENQLERSAYKLEIIYRHDLVIRLKNFINDILEITGLFKFTHTLITKLFSKREALSKQFIKGKGIEIGALHLPLKTYNAKVTYVDRMDVKGLRKHYPELRKFSLMKVDIIDNGERLAKIKNESQDFVIANHFIEHCENPIAVLKNHLRVLKKNGILYWAIPDKRYIFDNSRNLTTVDHIDNDFKKGGRYSRKEHYYEWVEKIMGLKNSDAVKKSKELMNTKYSIHFHVWTLKSFLEFLLFVKKEYKFPFVILKAVGNINEFIIILKKDSLV